MRSDLNSEKGGRSFDNPLADPYVPMTFKEALAKKDGELPKRE